MRLIIIVVISVGFIGGCSYINKKIGLDDDNFFEEVAEFIAEKHLNVPSGTIDFTPDTPE